MAWAASVTVSPTKMLHQQALSQSFWIYNNCGSPKGIQHLKFISQMWVNSLKALNVHLQSSTIKAFWHLMHVYVLIPFLVSFAGEPVKISIVFLIWSSFSFRLILWMFSISLIWSGLLHWQLVLQQWHQHSRVTTPVAAPTTAPATATAPASAVSGRSSGIGGGNFGPSPGLAAPNDAPNALTGPFSLEPSPTTKDWRQIMCKAHILIYFNVTAICSHLLIVLWLHRASIASPCRCRQCWASRRQWAISCLQGVLWESQGDATKNASNQ